MDRPPVMLLYEEGASRSRRRPWLVGTILVVLAGAVSLVLGVTRLRDAAAGPRPQAIAFATADRPVGFGLRSAIDTLRASLAAYDQRHSDFERGRIECVGLVAGYERVSRDVVEAARERRAAADPAPELIDAFDSIMEEASTADRRFDGSGCPRP